MYFFGIKLFNFVCLMVLFQYEVMPDNSILEPINPAGRDNLDQTSLSTPNVLFNSAPAKEGNPKAETFWLDGQGNKRQYLLFT